MWVERIDESANSPSSTRAPDLILLFGPSDILRASAMSANLQNRFPDAIHFGCSTGTTVDGATLSDADVVAVAVGFERTGLKLATQALVGTVNSRQVGRDVGSQLASPDLKGIFILSDGLAVNGSALVEGLRETVGDGVVVSGGLAGDGARFTDTLVWVGGEGAANRVAALGLYGESIRIAHGSAGGWDEFGPLRKITRAEGAVLFELDGQPALDLYERYLGDEASDLPASGLIYPLKIWNPARPDDEVVRTILSVDRVARSMTFAGDLPEGWSAKLMRGSFDRLADGAAAAADHASGIFAKGDIKPELCLFVSCVGRRLLMGQRTEDEVASVRAVLGEQMPLVGFYSYGEIAPHNRSGVCGLHNQTATLTLLAEAA